MSDENQTPEISNAEKAFGYMSEILSKEKKSFLPAQAAEAIQKLEKEGKLKAFIDEVEAKRGKARKETMKTAYDAVSNNVFKIWTMMKEELGTTPVYHDAYAQRAAENLENSGEAAEFISKAQSIDTKKKLGKDEYAMMLYGQMQQAIFDVQKESFVTAVLETYDAEGANKEQVAILAGEMMEASAKKNEEDNLYPYRTQAFTRVFMVNEEDVSSSVTGMIDLYAEKRKEDGFNIQDFASEVDGEYQRYQYDNEIRVFNEKIDAYYTGDDKEIVKEMIEHMPSSDRIKILQALASAEGETVNESYKERVIKDFNEQLSGLGGTFAHQKAMAPFVEEYMGLVDQAYNAYKDEVNAQEDLSEEDKKSALDAIDQLQTQAMFKSGAVFENGLNEFVKNSKRQAAEFEANEKGETFDAKKFDSEYTAPTFEDMEIAAPAYLQALKEVDETERNAQLRSEVENFSAQDDPKVGQKFKPTLSATILNGALTIGSSALAGMTVRGAGMAAGTFLLGSIGVAPILGAAIAGVAAGAVAGFASYNVTRLVKTMTKTRREFKENNKGRSFIAAMFASRDTKYRFRENFVASANKGARFRSMVVGAAVGGLFATYGDEIMGFVGDKFDAVQQTDLYQNTVGQINVAGLWDHVPFFGGDVTPPQPIDAVDPLDAFSGAGADVATPTPTPDMAAVARADVDTNPFLAAADTATNTAHSIPTDVDADLKTMIIDAAHENGTTSYEASIIDRLQGDSIGAQVQAAKDFSLQVGGDMQRQILERLNEDFGNIMFCPDSVQDPYLLEAVSQVNTDLGSLQLADAFTNHISDSAANEDLRAAIVNLMQGSDAGNHYAVENLRVAERFFPEAYDAAQREFATLSDGFTCAAQGANVVPEPDWAVGCNATDAASPAAPTTGENPFVASAETHAEAVAAVAPAADAAEATTPRFIFDLDASQPADMPMQTKAPLRFDGFECATAADMTTLNTEGLSFGVDAADGATYHPEDVTFNLGETAEPAWAEGCDVVNNAAGMDGVRFDAQSEIPEVARDAGQSLAAGSVDGLSDQFATSFNAGDTVHPTGDSELAATRDAFARRFAVPRNS